MDVCFSMQGGGKDKPFVSKKVPINNVGCFE